MTVPLPKRGEESLEPPTAEEVQAIADVIVWAARGDAGLTEVQRVLVSALVDAMGGTVGGAMGGDGVAIHDVPRSAGVDPDEFAEVMRDRSRSARARVVRHMLLCGLVSRPMPTEVLERITAVAAELRVDPRMIQAAPRAAEASRGLVALDFQRNGYTQQWNPAARAELHDSRELHEAWETAERDPDLASGWEGLADLDPDSLGAAVGRLYRARGFVVPGRPGSAPQQLAHHDWVHVLADYGTTAESELETFAFDAWAGDDLSGIVLLAMVASLFETGEVGGGNDLLEPESGAPESEALTIRVADAMRRGAACEDLVSGSTAVDFLSLDWFELAALPLDQARARFRVPARAEAAIVAGCVGPFEPGGISEFQLSSGRMMAEAVGRPYSSGGADPLE